MPTFKEQQRLLIQDQHRLAVWEMMFRYLEDNYISKDGRGAEKGIKVPGCIEDLVSQDTIEEIITSIAEGPIAQLRSNIDAIENMSIVQMQPNTGE